MALADNLTAACELNGDFTDSHGANDLTDNNTVGSGTGLVYATAADFESGNTEYLSIADNADLSFGDIDFTFEAWIKPESGVPNFASVLGKRDAFFDDFRLYFHSDLILFDCAGVSAFASVSAGNWYQVIVWHDATANEIGLVLNDGTPDTTATGGTAPADTAGEFHIGNRGGAAGAPWDGLIGPCRVWKRVLTSDEHTELYNAGAGRDYAYITGGGGGLIDNTRNILHNILGMAG